VTNGICARNGYFSLASLERQEPNHHGTTISIHKTSICSFVQTILIEK